MAYNTKNAQGNATVEYLMVLSVVFIVFYTTVINGYTLEDPGGGSGIEIPSVVESMGDRENRVITILALP